MSFPRPQPTTTRITLIHRQEPDAMYVSEGLIARKNPGSTTKARESTEPYVAEWPIASLSSGRPAVVPFTLNMPAASAHIEDMQPVTACKIPHYVQVCVYSEQIF